MNEWIVTLTDTTAEMEQETFTQADDVYLYLHAHGPSRYRVTMWDLDENERISSLNGAAWMDSYFSDSSFN